MAADPFLFPMYYLLFKTVSDKWGHCHPMRTEIAINFFFSWISMMDTGIFLLNIIFIWYRVCCQNTQVINMLRVYITALPEAVRSRQRFLMFPVRWVLQTAVRAAPGYSSAPISLAPCAFDTCLPGPAAFRSTAYPSVSTSKLAPCLLLGFAALRVTVSLISRAGFFFWKHTTFVP